MEKKELYYQKITEISEIKQYDKQRKQMHKIAEDFGVKFTKVFEDVKKQMHRGRGF